MGFTAFDMQLDNSLTLFTFDLHKVRPNDIKIESRGMI